MLNSDLLILRGPEVAALLEGRERELLDIVGAAYVAHGEGDSSLPYSNFLRFPGENRNRIIALPAYLGAGFGVAGMKWISSFPANLERGLDRASAVMVLNSTETGRPEAFLEGSLISAKRTAASAALAASVLQGERRSNVAGLVGCGLINFEVARFLRASCPEIERLVVFDLDPARAERFAESCRKEFEGVSVETAPDIASVLAGCKLVSFATTAVEPHVFDLSPCQPGSTILHVSLRDLAPELVLASDNVVDDVSHVCQAQTSVHLAEQSSGGRDFIRCTLADVLRGSAPGRISPESITIFSPFGLGVLDLAVGKFVLGEAARVGGGTVIESFLPDSWVEKKTNAAAHS
jgi:ornithine cyclodeaminase